MKECLDENSLDEKNITEEGTEVNLATSLRKLGLPINLIELYSSTNDVSYLYKHSRDPWFVNQLVELMKSSKSYLRSGMNVQNNPAPLATPRRGRIENEAIQRPNELMLECRKELIHQYMVCRNTLKLALLPTSEHKIHGVQDLHVPVVLKKIEISPDLPDMTNIHTEDFFKRPDRPTTKMKILLIGPPGVGKSTEVKKWIYDWCNKKEGPLKHFRLVFYIDGAKLQPATSLGEAVISQCLQAKSKFSSEGIERMCRECGADVLVILDNYNKWKKKSHEGDSSSLEKMVLLQDFTSVTLLVATTSVGVGDFLEVYANYEHVKAEGISEESVHTYVQQVFKKRREFGEKVEKFLEDTQQISYMAASPVLLSIMCQIVKWHKNPEVLGDLKTGSALIDKFIDCIIKHTGEPPSSQFQRRSDDLSSTHIEENADRKEEDQDTSSAANFLPGPLSSATPTRRNKVRSSGQSLSTDEIKEQLAAVAFHCYLKEDQLEELYLSEDDLNVCGDLKSAVITEGCRLGLLVKSYVEELNPSSSKAAEGKIIRFLNAPIQQRLAAKHLVKLLQGNEDEKQSFHTSIEKIGSIDDALALRNLLLFACEESVVAATRVISRVVDLTRPVLDQRPDDRVLRQNHGRNQYMIEFILDLNYAAKAKGRHNEILRPLVSRLRILSPTVVLTRALAYLLEHSSSPPKLEDVDIEVFDVPREIMENLPHLEHQPYGYEERAEVKIEYPSERGASSAPEPPRSIIKRKLSIKIPPKKPKEIAAKFPQPPKAVVKEKRSSFMPFTETDALPFKADYQERVSANDGSLPVSVPAGNDRGVISDGRAIKAKVQEIDRKCIKVVSDLLAEGRFGEVYKATYEDKVYAMKRIKHVEKGYVKRIIREIKLNERVSHPNIVVLHAYAQYPPVKDAEYHRFELLMDYIEGPTLAVAIFGEEKLKLKHLETRKGKLYLAFKVCDAISHMHANGCTHSDIKPNNILIRLHDNEPFVCDLGSGHVVCQSTMSVASSGTRYGVQRWMPPESSGQGYEASIEGDLWSLASVLAEVFTRRHIWEGLKTDVQLIARLSNDDVIPELLSEIKDESIKNILRRCFTKITKDRPHASKLVSTFKRLSDLA